MTLENQRSNWRGGGGGARKTASFLISGRHAIIKNYLNGSLLLLYSPEVIRSFSFKSIMRSALSNGAIGVYAGPHCEDFRREFHAEEGKKLFHTVLLTERTVCSATEKLTRFLSTAEPSKRTVFLINDFSDSATAKHLPAIVALQKKIGEQVSGQKMHAINAFDITTLDSEKIEALVSCNKKTIFTSNSEMVLSFLPEKSEELKTSIKIFPHVLGERFVKDSLEYLIYSMLLKGPICGNDVIRKIADEHHVALSQSTVYPVLYALHKKGLVTVAKDSRAKNYSLTEEGESLAKTELSEMHSAHTYFLSLIDKI